MGRQLDPELTYARKRAYRSLDPFWWSNLAAVYATRECPSLERARLWYRRAALEDDLRGLFEYGLMIVNGEGGPKRPTQGRRLIERAAALGDVDALKVISHAYAHGALGFRRSPAKARRIRLTLRRMLTELKRRPAG